MVQLFSDDTAETLNGSGPHIDPGDPPFSDEEDETQEYDYSTLFDAPSYSDFIKTPPNAKSRVYERKVQSMMKAGMVMSLNNQQWPDAATFLKHGPGFARAAGNLAAEDARAAQVIDMLTAPDSPYVMFGLVAFGMVAQLVRNHQPEIHEVANTWRQRREDRKNGKDGARVQSPPLVLRIGKRSIKLPIRFRVRLPKFRAILAGFLAPTQRPDTIAQEVFSDPSVVRALHKMGLFPRSDTNASN